MQTELKRVGMPSDCGVDRCRVVRDAGDEHRAASRCGDPFLRPSGRPELRTNRGYPSRASCPLPAPFSDPPAIGKNAGEKKCTCASAIVSQFLQAVFAACSTVNGQRIQDLGHLPCLFCGLGWLVRFHSFANAGQRLHRIAGVAARRIDAMAIPGAAGQTGIERQIALAVRYRMRLMAASFAGGALASFRRRAFIGFARSLRPLA